MNKHEIGSLRTDWLVSVFALSMQASGLQALLVAGAPTNELLMLQIIEYNKQVDGKIFGVAKCKMRLHLWHLSKGLAAS